MNPGPKLIGVVVLICLAVSSRATDIATYVKAGISAPDREWRGQDYGRAAQILASKKVPLPRLSDKQEKVLLQRLTSTENLEFYKNRTLPVSSRLQDFFSLQEGVNSIVNLYLAAVDRGENMKGEMVRVTAFMLHAWAAGAELVDEFLPTIPRDEKYEIRMDGLRKMYLGMMTVFSGIETSLGERRIYAAEHLSILLEAMASTLPKFKKAFSESYKLELQLKLRDHKKAFTLKQDLDRIDQMLTELRK